MVGIVVLAITAITARSVALAGFGLDSLIEMPLSLGDLIADRPDLAPIYANALPVQLIDAQEVSNAVLFLVSDESRHVTGLEFKVDAGVTIR